MKEPGPRPLSAVNKCHAAKYLNKTRGFADYRRCDGSNGSKEVTGVLADAKSVFTGPSLRHNFPIFSGQILEVGLRILHGVLLDLLEKRC